jgi:hypothetical protein
MGTPWSPVSVLSPPGGEWRAEARRGFAQGRQSAPQPQVGFRHLPVTGFTHDAVHWQMPSDRQTPRFVTAVGSSLHVSSWPGVQPTLASSVAMRSTDPESSVAVTELLPQPSRRAAAASVARTALVPFMMPCESVSCATEGGSQRLVASHWLPVSTKPAARRGQGSGQCGAPAGSAGVAVSAAAADVSCLATISQLEAAISALCMLPVL